MALPRVACSAVAAAPLSQLAVAPPPILSPIPSSGEAFSNTTAFPPLHTSFDFPWHTDAVDDDPPVDRKIWFYFGTQRLNEELSDIAPWWWFTQLSQFGLVGVHRLRPRGLSKQGRPRRAHDYAFAFKSSDRRDLARVHVEQVLHRKCIDWHPGKITTFVFTTVMDWEYVACVYASDMLDGMPGLRSRLLAVAPQQWTTQTLFKEVMGIASAKLNELNATENRNTKYKAELFDIPSGRSGWIEGEVLQNKGEIWYSHLQGLVS